MYLRNENGLFTQFSGSQFHSDKRQTVMFVCMESAIMHAPRKRLVDRLAFYRENVQTCADKQTSCEVRGGFRVFQTSGLSTWLGTDRAIQTRRQPWSARDIIDLVSHDNWRTLVARITVPTTELYHLRNIGQTNRNVRYTFAAGKRKLSHNCYRNPFLPGQTYTENNTATLLSNA